MTTAPDIFLNSSASPRPMDCESSSAIRTIFWVAVARTATDERFCRVRTISDDGMTLATNITVTKGDRIWIALSDKITLSGEVTWDAHGRVGLRLEKSIDSVGMLQALAGERHAGRYRMPRLCNNLMGIAISEYGLSSVRLLDISQRGMKIEHEGCFKTDLPVKIALENGLARHGVVRWSRGGVAGLQLLEPISLQEIDMACTYSAGTDLEGGTGGMTKQALA